MLVKSKFKHLIAFASLICKVSLICTVSLTANAAKRSNQEAPEVTPAEITPAEVTPTESTLSFWDLPFLKQAYITASPTDRKDALAVGELGVDGGNKAMIFALAQELADNKLGDYDSMLISYKDKLLFESYYKRGRINLPHFQFSGTKAYTALMIGRAIQLGHLTMADLNKPVVNFLKGLDATKFTDGIETITLHKAMTMRSGLRFTDEQLTNFREAPEQFNGIVQVQAFFEQSAPVTSLAQTFKYQSPDPIIVMQVLDAVVPGTAKDFIKGEFFDKLGINDYTWGNDLSGLPTDNGVNLTSRDMLKVGAIINNAGKWNGEQLIPANYLTKATSAFTQPNEDWQPKTFSYGYFWYQTNLTTGNQSYDVKVAWGAGGNRIIIVQKLDLVVAITGHDLEDTIFSQVSKAILPAFIQ